MILIGNFGVYGKNECLSFIVNSFMDGFNNDVESKIFSLIYYFALNGNLYYGYFSNIKFN